MRRRRNPEIIAGRVNADGTIATGDGFTVQKTGTGAYSVAFGPGFRLLAPTASAVAAGPQGASTGSHTDRSFVAYTWTTGALADIAFTFVAAGVQQ